MIDFNTIAFTEEEATEIAQLETTAPAKAAYLKLHLALEKLNFIVPVGVAEMEGRLVNANNESIESLVQEWKREEYEGGTRNTSMTFIRLIHPEHENVTITFRKQSEKQTNSFNLRIKD